MFLAINNTVSNDIDEIVESVANAVFLHRVRFSTNIRSSFVVEMGVVEQFDLVEMRIRPEANTIPDWLSIFAL